MSRVPRRDWRDWFIMATVTGGIGYGLYFLTKASRLEGFFSFPTTNQLIEFRDTSFLLLRLPHLHNWNKTSRALTSNSPAPLL